MNRQMKILKDYILRLICRDYNLLQRIKRHDMEDKITKPTIEEVKAHFKNADILCCDLFEDMRNENFEIDLEYWGVYWDEIFKCYRQHRNDNGDSWALWHDGKYATIVLYKSGFEPKLFGLANDEGHIISPVFKAEDYSLAHEWVEKNLDKFNLNESHSCSSEIVVELGKESKSIAIIGDKDFQEFDIVDIKVLTEIN